jgi:uncharacterized protein (DUF2236 family)
MHPTIAAGIGEHSDFTTHPWQRLRQTWSLVLRTIYGPDAEDVGARVRAAHRHISGTDRQGRRYHAYQPEAYWWVLATGLDSLYTLAGRFAPPLSNSDKRRAYVETRELGRRFGLRDRDMQDTLDEFNDWYGFILNERLENNPTVQDFFRVIANPPPPPGCPSILWPPVRSPASATARLLTIGTLPTVARDRLDLPWTRAQEANLNLIAVAFRSLGVIPARLRYLEIAHTAYARAGTPVQATRAVSRPGGVSR